MPEPEKKTSPLTLALAWTIVTVPLGWGIYQTVVKSLPLFRIAVQAPSTAHVPGPRLPR